MNKLIAKAKSGACEFWQARDGQVYRCQSSPLDVFGLPASRRWECSVEHWKQYRAVFDWVEDVA